MTQITHIAALRLVLLFGFLLIRPGIAGATEPSAEAPPEPSTGLEERAQALRTCRALWALSDLRVQDRRFAYEICELDALGKLDEGGEELEPERKNLRKKRIARAESIARGLAPRGNWQLITFTKLVVKKLQKPGSGTQSDVGTSGDGEIGPELETAVQRAREKASRHPRTPLELPSDGTGLVPVVVASEKAPVLVAGPDGSIVRTRSKKIGNQTYHMGLVPRGERYTVGIPSDDGRTVLGDTATYPVLLRTSGVETRCLDLDVAVDRRATLLLDGQVVEPGLHTILPGVHQVTLLGGRTRDGFPVQIEEELSSDAFHRRASAGYCTTWRADLRSSKTVTLTPVHDVDDACKEAAAGTEQLWSSAAAFLRDRERATGLYFRDMRSVAQAVDHLGRLRDALSAGAGQPIGATRLSAATDVQIGTAAKELWRQGVAAVVSLDLQCSAGHGEVPPSYTIVARSVDVNTAFTGVKDPVTGASLRKLANFESETVKDAAEINRAMRRTVSRLLGLPYLRFSDDGDRHFFHSRIDVLLEVVPPTRGAVSELPVVVSSYELADKDAAAICKPLESTGRIAGREPSSYALGRPVKGLQVVPLQSSTARGGRTRSYTVELRPRSAGTLLLRARLGKGDAPLDQVFRCVRVESPRHVVWGAVSAGIIELGTQQPFEDDKPLRGPFANVYSQVRVGANQYLDLTASALFFGGYIGYANVRRSTDTLLSWEDFTPGDGEEGEDPSVSPHAEDDGTVSLSWWRHGLQLGPTLGFDGSWCRLFRRNCGVGSRRIEGSVMASLGMDIGFVQTNGVPESLMELREVSPSRNVLVDVDLVAGLEVGLGYHFRGIHKLILLFGLYVPGLDDGIVSGVGAKERSTSSVRYDFDLVFTVGVRMGWDI